VLISVTFFFSSRRRHTRSKRDWSSDVCSSDLGSMSRQEIGVPVAAELVGAERTQLLQQLERAEVRIEEIRRHLERADQAIARTKIGRASCRERAERAEWDGE